MTEKGLKVKRKKVKEKRKKRSLRRGLCYKVLRAIFYRASVLVRNPTAAPSGAAPVGNTYTALRLPGGPTRGYGNLLPIIWAPPSPPLLQEEPTQKAPFAASPVRRRGLPQP